MTYVYGSDFPPAQYVYDATGNANLTSASYATLSPEVGVYFPGPSSGRVMITVGGAGRDNTNDNRVFMSVTVTAVVSGAVEVAADVNDGGFGTPGVNADYMYASRTFMVDNLTRGVDYYAQVLVAVETTGGTTADVAVRDILVEPLP